MLFRAERFSNVGKYIDDLREHFSSEFNAATLELPLTERYFELPINDTLFQEYDHRIRQKKGAADRTPPDGGLIYERKVIENRLRRRVYDTDEPHFKFNLKFGKFKQVHRSKDNLAKSILNLLNLVSLWLIRGNFLTCLSIFTLKLMIQTLEISKISLFFQVIYSNYLYSNPVYLLREEKRL